MKLLITAMSAMLFILLVGCVAAPTAGGGVSVAPAGVAYIEPTYVRPGPGYAWNYHAQYGWGWYHPQYGWHRGWR